MRQICEFKDSRGIGSVGLGVIGLGIIGGRVAENLRNAGHRVWVWSRTVRALPNFVGSPAEVARNAERLFLYVADGPSLHANLEQMRAALTPRHVVVNHSTVSPAESLRAASIVESVGARFLDAPFTGSRDAAAANQLVYYIGGEAKTLEDVRPILELTSREILPMGKVGDASLVKIATNMVTAATVAVLSEAVGLVEAHGVDASKFAQALNSNAARSGVSDLKLAAILERDFEPRFSLRNMIKDMRLAEEMEEGHGVEPRLVRAFLALAETAEKEGHSEKDFAVISNLTRPAAGKS